MACARCHREALSIFIREIAGVNVPRSSSVLFNRGARRFQTRASNYLQSTTKAQHSDASTRVSPATSDESYIPFDRSTSRSQSGHEDSSIPLPPAFKLPPPPAESKSDQPEYTLSKWADRRSVSSFQADITLNDSALLEAGANVTIDAVGHEDETISQIVRQVKPGPASASRKRGRQASGAKVPNLNKPSKKTHELRLHRWRAERGIPFSSTQESGASQATPDLIEKEKASSATKSNARLRQPIDEEVKVSRADKGFKLRKAEMSRVPRADTNHSTSYPRQRPIKKVDAKASAVYQEKPKREPWQVQKRALQSKFGDEHWSPRKKLSPDAVEGIRALHAQYPEQFSTPQLAAHFEVSPEAIRRILKSKWKPNEHEEEDRRVRWDKRGEKIWSQLVEKGVHPPKKWRMMGIGGGPRYASQAGAPPSERRSILGTRMLAGKKNVDEEEKARALEANKGSAWVDSMVKRM